jgi:hypothetical protein
MPAFHSPTFAWNILFAKKAQRSHHGRHRYAIEAHFHASSALLPSFSDRPSLPPQPCSGMRFLTDVESGNVGGVQLLLRKGQVSPNLNYLGVYPLNLCLERGDIDMAAVLLTAGADPIMKTDPLNKPDKKITNAMEFAEMISKDKKHPFRMEAQVMLEMFNSEEKLKQRFAAVQVRLQKELDRDTVLAKRFGLLTLAVGALGFGYWYYLY